MELIQKYGNIVGWVTL